MMFAALQPPPAPLSLRLREATAAAHRAAERSRFLRRLLRGELERPHYAGYLAGLRRVYATLEDGLARHAGHPALAGFPWDALARRQALARDLAALCGPTWPQAVARDRHADAYVAALAAAAPHELLAHAYVRYLGDLSGGQMLRAAVARFAPEALAFYEFPALPEVPRARDEFRARLDARALTEAEAAEVVAEACAAFAANTALLAAQGG
jgi:heme oxygenase